MGILIGLVVWGVIVITGAIICVGALDAPSRQFRKFFGDWGL